jgi:hypothetical protein
MANVVVDNVAEDGNGVTHVKQLFPDGLTTYDYGDGRIGARTTALSADRFDPGPGQVAFELAAEPLGDVQMYVNGSLQTPGEDFTVVGRQATWLDNGFQLGPGDRVAFVYARGA